MPDSHDPHLSKRVDALENELRIIRQRLDSLVSDRLSQPVRSEVHEQSTPNPANVSTRQPVDPKAPHHSEETRRAPRRRLVDIGTSEQWINRIGMSLLLLGLVFLFKYSIDRGWLTPLIRVIFGGVLGVALIGVGSRLKESRTLGLVLLGGGIAALYTTLFAAYQLYALIPYMVAFIGMVLVTLTGYYFAIQQSTAVIAIVATMGGLSTPFLLYREGGSLPALVVYLCLVVGSAAELYYYKGWRSVLVTAFVGGWACLIAGWIIPDLDWILGTRPTSEGIVFQAGILFTLLAVGVVPAVRIFRSNRNPDRWPTPTEGIFRNLPTFYQPGHLAALFSPLIAAAMTVAVWEPGDNVWGAVMVISSAVYGAAYVWLYERDSKRLASMHGFASAIFLAIAIVTFVDNHDVISMLLAAEASLVLWLGLRKEDTKLVWLGHIGMFIMGLAILDGLDYTSTESPVFNLGALSDLIIAGLFIFGGWISRHRLLKTGYFLFGYFCFLSIVARELTLFSDGQAYVTVVWGVCAIGLLIAGRYFANKLLRLMGFGTLALVVGKLLFVDLAQIDAGWRVLLFLGLGGLLLLLSYFFPQLWELPDEEENEPVGSDDMQSTTEVD